jgi:hypothetical protein
MAMEILMEKQIGNGSRPTAIARWSGLLAIGAMLMLALSAAQAADLERSRGIQVGMIYNFAQLVTWPRNHGHTQDSFNLCFLRADEMMEASRILVGKPTPQGPMKLVNIEQVEQCEQCRILFVGVPRAGRFLRAMNSIISEPVLTVSNSSDFITAGGMVRMFADNNRVRFELASTLASNAGLQVDGKMAELATNYSIAGHPASPETGK